MKFLQKWKNDLYPSASQLADLYALSKIHKAVEDRILSFRPFLSAIGTSTYKLATFCDQLLKQHTKMNIQ